MSNRGFGRFAPVLLLVLVAGAPAQSAPPIEYETFTLSNGLRFIVHEDHSAPVAAVDVWYDVGSAHEKPGRSGFAHLFEHLLFEETENLDKGDFDDYLTRAGGWNNGSTTEDRTNYFEMVPSNRVNLALWLEAERMANLRVTETNFEREREVVKEERRLRIDNQPYGEAFLTLDTLAADWPPYEHTVIGSMADLDAATVQDVIEFRDTHYVPNNAAVVVAGDVTVTQVRELAEELFGAIPRGPDRERLPAIPATPRTDGERRVVLEDELATIPLFMAAFNVPPHAHPDSYALTHLVSILGQGESSRLHQRLVKEERAALQVQARLGTRAGPSTVTIFALANQGVDVARLEALVWEEVERIKEGVTPRELEKAKNQMRASMIMGRQSVMQRAESLHHYRRYHGDIAEINTDMDRYSGVTATDVQRVAETYLTEANRTVVIALPSGAAAGREGES